MKKIALLGASALAVAMAATPASALNIMLRADSSFTSQPNGAAALYAFRKAANFWNATLKNNATLNFDVSFANLGNPNVIGQTGSNSLTLSTKSVYSALAANSATALDKVAVANLRPLSAAGGVAYRMPDSVAGRATGSTLGLDTIKGSVYDNNDSLNNTLMVVNTANARAMGLGINADNTAFGNTSDAEITFNSAFAFDFDPTDGIGAGKQDFTSVAIHEMGHALGFVSGADVYDFYANPNGPGRTGLFGNTFDWDKGQYFTQFGQFVTPEVLTTLDLFRYSANGASTGGFTPDGKRILQLDPNRTAGFSIDAEHFFNGNGRASFFSTGRYNGDLQQASHWKESQGSFDFNNCFVADDPQIGIMDPTSGSCQVGLVTSNDLAAFDAIGYNLDFDITQNKNYTFSSAQAFGLAGLASVPEPASWAMMLGGFGFAGAAVRRRRRMSVRVTYA